MTVIPSSRRFIGLASLLPSYLILWPTKSYRWISNCAFHLHNRYDSVKRLFWAKLVLVRTTFMRSCRCLPPTRGCHCWADGYPSTSPTRLPQTEPCLGIAYSSFWSHPPLSPLNAEH